MSRIVVTTMGSLGDLHPVLPIAAGLRARGHLVSFGVPAEHSPAVAAEGFETWPIPQLAGSFRFSADGGKSARLAMQTRFPVLFANALSVLRPLCSDADLVLTTPHQLAAAAAAIELEIPWVTLTMFPGNIPSGYTVPKPHWMPALPGPPGRVLNRLTWRLFQLGVDHISGDVIDATLGASGIAADRRVFTPGGLSPHLCLVLSSPAYSPPLPDWPAHVKVTGFTGWDEPTGWIDPPGLEAFLAGGAPPVIVTTSSAPDRDALAYFEVAVRALEESGHRGILLLGGLSAADLKYGPEIAVCNYVPISRLIPRSSFVIHHAGIGTTLATLRGGRTAVAVPSIYDQWYNSDRIEKLGVGRVLPIGRYNRQQLVREMSRLQRPSYAANAAAMAVSLAGEDAVSLACREIETLLGR